MPRILVGLGVAHAAVRQRPAPRNCPRPARDPRWFALSSRIWSAARPHAESAGCGRPCTAWAAPYVFMEKPHTHRPGLHPACFGRGARLDVGLGVFGVFQLGRRRAPPAVFKREPQEHPIKIFRADFRNWPRVRQICPKYAAVTKYYAVSERDGISYPSEYS